MADIRLLDLHNAVPDPPDQLLGLDALHRRIRRWRLERTLSTAIAIIVLTAAITVGAVAASHRSSHLVPASHANGPILFAESTPSHGDGLDQSHLALLDPATRHVTALTHQSGAVVDAAASPDGKIIAYVREVDTPSANQHAFRAHLAIYVINVDGSGQRVLYQCEQGCFQLSWSPKGGQIAFVDRGIKTINLSGDVRTVCPARCGHGVAEQPRWSPNGRQLVFSERGYVGELGPAPMGVDRPLWLVNADGSGLRKLTNLACATLQACGIDVDPRWTPDGSEILFTSLPILARNTGRQNDRSPSRPNGIYEVRPDGSHLRALWRCRDRHDFCGLGDPVPSPTENRVAFVGGNRLGGVSLLSLASNGGVRDIGDHLGGAASVTWSPDGKALVILVANGRNPGVLEVIAPNTKARPSVINDASADGPLLWLPGSN